MDPAAIEDALSSLWDWFTAETDDSRVNFSGSDLVARAEPISNQDKIIREYLIDGYKNVQKELAGLRADIEKHQETLSKYVVGIDDKRLLTEICDSTLESLSFLQVDEKSAKYQACFHDEQLKLRSEICTGHLQSVEDLQVEGAGGAEHEENISLYQCAHYLIHKVRDLLDVITRLLGFQSKKNSLAETVIYRPFFFQTPCSPQEVIEIRQARDDLKDAIDQVSNEAISTMMDKEFNDMVSKFNENSELTNVENYIEMIERVDLFTFLNTLNKGK